MSCKFYARYGTMCGCNEHIEASELPGFRKHPAVIRVKDHRACMGEQPELCDYYQKI